MEIGGHSDDCVKNVDIVIASPGVPDTAKPIKIANAENIPVINEVEFAVQHTNAKIIAITGTNGKTTTTTLIGHILNYADKPAIVAGNIGQALCGVVEKATSHKFLVVELSSFQLETMKTFHPYIAVWLNLTPDHLDRHGTMENYAAAKGKMFMNMNSDDWSVIWNNDREITKPFIENTGVKTVWIDEKGKWKQTPEQPYGTTFDSGELVSIFNGNKQLHGQYSELKLKGTHNIINILAAISVARILHIPNYIINEALLEFRGLPHRLEFITEKNGIIFLNDSKATNIDAVSKALESVDKPISLIAGGYDKGGDFTPLINIVKEKVNKLVLIGEAASMLKEVFKDIDNKVIVHSMKQAVETASADVPVGTTVLLSPGCASFDMYDNFEKRGEDFTKCVLSLN
ncbi:MAG: UDP-N-acetylmuramoyl-L-alanine--D-glutamate ligase [Chlamydiae bacterium]|nr:MAG: UDP-N-acetylmuramoyl-L-alanine--D-glutamate ligase [Chlamydiota bacterium]